MLPRLITRLWNEQRRWVLAGALVVVLVVAGFLYMRHDEDPTAPLVPQDTAGPVLLIPGYGGDTTSVDALASVLQAQGRTTETVALPDGGVGDLQTQARVVAAAGKALLAKTGAKTLDVIGYSAGGIVARIWVREDGGSAIVRRAVSLGSPQHGTELASFGGALAPSQCPKACQQMMTDSDLLTYLNSGREAPSGPTWVSIWSSDDDVVRPPDSAHLEGALNIPVQSVCPNASVSHTALPTTPLVQQMVLAVLADGPAVPLTNSDCARLGG